MTRNAPRRPCDTNEERAGLDKVDPAMMTVVGRSTSLTEVYRRAALEIMRRDDAKALPRKEIHQRAMRLGLVPSPVNVPVLRLALRDLVNRGDIVRVANGWYRLEWRRRSTT